MATEVIVILAGTMIFSADLALAVSARRALWTEWLWTVKRRCDDEESVYFRAALNYISSGHYKEALNVLNNILQHSAQWYYYSSIANQGLGNNAAALEQAEKGDGDGTAERRICRLAAADGVRRQLVYRTTDAVWWNAGIQWQRILLEAVSGQTICNLCCGGGGMRGGMPQDTLRKEILYADNCGLLQSDRKYQKACNTDFCGDSWRFQGLKKY